jgi:hypothetical protein
MRAAIAIAIVSLLVASSALAMPRLATLSPLATLAEQVQYGPGGQINAGRDCQTIRTCNYTRGGAFRGCLSSYSCRVCRYVTARCTITGRERVCTQSVCTWGG